MKLSIWVKYHLVEFIGIPFLLLFVSIPPILFGFPILSAIVAPIAIFFIKKYYPAHFECPICGEPLGRKSPLINLTDYSFSLFLPENCKNCGFNLKNKEGSHKDQKNASSPGESVRRKQKKNGAPRGTEPGASKKPKQ
ncbi:MAG: hypothetical protein MZU97_08115 [Bacillus subtilis]|nr:hypothetical protein [Bacillus subtilis]